MRNLHCPQCDVQRFQVKNELNETLLVTVNERFEIIPVHATDSTSGFDLTILYCLGCSWHGSPKSLIGGKHSHYNVQPV
jgi:hypothetical protein